MSRYTIDFETVKESLKVGIRSLEECLKHINNKEDGMLVERKLNGYKSQLRIIESVSKDIKGINHDKFITVTITKDNTLVIEKI